MGKVKVPEDEINRFVKGRIITYGAFQTKRVYMRDSGKFIGIGWTGRYYPAIGDDLRFTRGNATPFIVLDSQLANS